MHDFLADEAACGSTVFAECDGEGAQCVECRTSLRGLLPAMGEQSVELDGKSDGRERAGPASAHGIGYGDTHG